MSDVDARALERLLERAAAEVDAGHCTAAQLALAHRGEVVASASFGRATDDTRFVIFSATKALVAFATAPLLADGRLDVTRPVAQYVPEFAANGKHQVTVEQVMLMQGGFPQAPMGSDDWATSTGRRARMARWRLDWPPGTRCEYHPLATHWVLAEVIEAITGRCYLDHVHDTVTEPAGVPRLLGVPVTEQRDVAEVRAIGQRPDDAALVAAFGRPEWVPQPSVGVDALLVLNDPAVRAVGLPGGGALARAVDVARVYQWVLGGDGGGDGMDPEVRHELTGHVRNTMLQASSGLPANRTLGVVVAGDDGCAALRWFPTDRPRTFGHHGAGGQLCWADPDSGWSFCFLHDTLHHDPRVELERARALNELAVASVVR